MNSSEQFSKEFTPMLYKLFPKHEEGTEINIHEGNRISNSPNTKGPSLGDIILKLQKVNEKEIFKGSQLKKK